MGLKKTWGWRWHTSPKWWLCPMRSQAALFLLLFSLFLWLWLWLWVLLLFVVCVFVVVLVLVLVFVVFVVLLLLLLFTSPVWLIISCCIPILMFFRFFASRIPNVAASVPFSCLWNVFSVNPWNHVVCRWHAKCDWFPSLDIKNL